MFHVQSSCGPTPLLDAAQAGDDRRVKALLSTEPHLDVNARDYDGRTPLLLAAINGHTAVASQLLSHGANPNWQDLRRVVPLWYAASSGHAGVVRALLESGQLSDVNPMHKSGEEKAGTPLSIALKKGYRDVVDLLVLEDSVDPFVQIELDERIEGQASVIGLAVRNGFEDAAITLLDKFVVAGSSQGAVTGSELLFLAASVGSTQLVTKLLTQPYSVDPNTTFPFDDYRFRGLTPFLVAIEHGHGPVARLLLATKCIPLSALNEALFEAKTRDVLKLLLENESVEADRKNSDGRTPLSVAAEKGYEAVVEEFLLETEKVDPDSRDDQGRTPLVWAVGKPYDPIFKTSWEGELSIVQRLLASGRVDPNPADKNGITPLYLAVKNGASCIVKAILKCSKIGPDADGDNGGTLLSLAASEGHGGVVEVLLRTWKIDINAIYGEYTALSLAASKGRWSDKSVVTVLLAEPDIDPNKKNGDGTTPLTIAAEENDLTFVRELLAAGADPNTRDNMGRTPLHRAIIPYHVTYEGHAANVIKELLGLTGIDPDPVNFEGRTPISLAAERGHGELVDVFIAVDRINPDSMDALGRSPLSWAIDPGAFNDSYNNMARRKEVVRRLLQVQTVNPNAEDAEGLTPLTRAIKTEHGSEFVGLLLDRSDLDIQSKDLNGRTPIALAREFKSTATISLLISRGAVNDAPSISITDDDNRSTTDKPNITSTSVAEEDIQCTEGQNRTKSDSYMADKAQDDQESSDTSDDSVFSQRYDVGETTKHRLQYELARSIRLPLGAQHEYSDVVESSAADLCPTCASIDLDTAFSDRETHYSGKHIAYLGHVDNTWSTRKCPMCRLIAAVHPTAHEDGDGSQYKLVAFSSTAILLCSDLLASWDHFQEPWIDTMVLGVVRDSGEDADDRWVRYSSFSSVLRYGMIGRVGSNCPDGEQAITISPRLATHGEADLRIAKRCIAYCSGTHSRRCNSRHRPPVPHFYLIDCRTRMIVRQSDKSVSPTYVALSYVWGQPPTSGSDPATAQMEWIRRDENGHQILRPLADGGVEPVVEDSIHVALELGYQYLWVDRYCIDQSSDMAVKQQQLQSMHKVYANAHVTLVMAAGRDASSGLAGATRCRPRVAMPCARVKGHILTCIPPEPSEQTLSSAWAERGWTYQEGLFAHRRLFFSEREMSYECQSLVCREAIRLPPRVVRLMGKKLRGPRLMRPSWIYDGRGVMASDMGGFDLFKLLTNYTARRLTYQSDALNAMMGILQAFGQRKRNPVYNICGVPVLCNSYSFGIRSKSAINRREIISRGGDVVASVALAGFVSGLCWELKEVADRRDGFPSWSWTGWRGVVSREPPGIVCGSGFDVEVSVVCNGESIIPWDDCYRRLVKAMADEEASTDIAFSGRSYALCIRACVVAARLYTQYCSVEKVDEWKGIITIGDSVWRGLYHATRKDYLPSDLVRPRRDGASVMQSWQQRLLEETWLGIVLWHNREEMKVLIVQEQLPPSANEYTYWERIGMLNLWDVSLESNMLERRTLMLV
ncbi:hypothetical protein PG999_003013 [Apiospora kogelbergensis]|uniref:Heterokaryon incompatibility domain-containing protein n=1 Tax=Apiospora kogelbergensis TaxID=1337665 RepID=A0AAW0RA53_9PEZI